MGRAEGVEQMTFDVKGKVGDRKEKRMLTKPENFERVQDRNGLGEKVVDVGGRVQLDQTVFLVQKKEISVRFSSESRGRVVLLIREVWRLGRTEGYKGGHAAPP